MKDVLMARQELIEMVEFLESGNLEWLKQGGHLCVMSDKTFMRFEQECMYEKLRTELCEPHQESQLVEHSLNLFNQ